MQGSCRSGYSPGVLWPAPLSVPSANPLLIVHALQVHAVVTVSSCPGWEVPVAGVAGGRGLVLLEDLGSVHTQLSK